MQGLAGGGGSVMKRDGWIMCSGRTANVMRVGEGSDSCSVIYPVAVRDLGSLASWS